MSKNPLKLLETAVAKRTDLLRNEFFDTTAWRLIHSVPDGFPGLTVDTLGDALLIEQHDRDAEIQSLIDGLIAHFGVDKPMFLKERWSNRESQSDGNQVNGAPTPTESIVQELGLYFRVRLTHSTHIGLFLDSRPARRCVKAISHSKRVLNLFSYTGGFGVAAAAGGALSTTNVDNKRSALECARYNYGLNKLTHNTRTFIRSDVFSFVTRALKGTGQYDLVILDPPPKTRRSNGRWFVAQTGYARLAARCLKLLAPKGRMLAGLNSTSVTDPQFIALVQEAGDLAKTPVTVQQQIGPGADFPFSTDRPHARFALCTVG